MATKTLYAKKSAVIGKRPSNGRSGYNFHETHLQLGWQAATSERVRGLIKFPHWEIPDGATITSATMRLTFYSPGSEATHSVQAGAKDADILVRMMKKDWGFSNNPGEGMFSTQHPKWHWDNLNGATREQRQEIKKNVDQGATDAYITIDISNMFRGWYNGALANYGLQLKNNTSESDDDYALLFFSAEASVARQPQLVVEYEPNEAPTSIDATPDDEESVDTLLPTFNLQMNDPENDDITAWSIVVSDYATGAIHWKTDKQATNAGGTQLANGQTIAIPYGVVDPYTSLLPLAASTTYKWQATLWDRGSNTITLAERTFITNAKPNVPDVVVTPSPLNAVPSATPTISVTHNDPDPTDTLMDGYQVVVQGETSEGTGDWTDVWDTDEIDISSDPQSVIQVSTGTLDWGGSYRVICRTQDSHGAWSSYSPPIYFVVAGTASPINLWPASSASAYIVPVLSGERGDSSDYISKYEIALYTDDLSGTLLAETEYTDHLDGARFTKPYPGSALTAGNGYQWKARVYSTTGGWSGWSSLQRFVVEDSNLVPYISSPVGDNDYSPRPQVTFGRSIVFNAVQYEIYAESAIDGALGSSHYSSGTISTGSAYSFSEQYPSLATVLEMDEAYKIRARCSNDGGSNWDDWSGLNWFKTETVEGGPTLVSVAGSPYDPAWIITTTPLFVIEKNPGDPGLIDELQIRIHSAKGAGIICDSGLVDVDAGFQSSAYIAFTGQLLVPGNDYLWDARYRSTDTNGPLSPFSAKNMFRVNAPPSIPTGLFPNQSYAFNNETDQVFQAEFSDPEVATYSDYPTAWEIVVEELDGTEFDTITVTDGLKTGLNSYTWAGDTFDTDTDYRWKTRFKDRMEEWGPYSSWLAFSVSDPPNGTITAPSNDSNISTVTPEINWTYSGGTQKSYVIEIDRTNANGVVQEAVARLEYEGTETSRTIPAGYFKNGKYYDITLTVKNTANLEDPSPSTVNVTVVLDAPDPVVCVDSVVDLDYSSVTLEWCEASLKVGHSFVAYRIYRRRKDLTTDWEWVADVPDRGKLAYIDWYAGNGVFYQYVVRAVTTKSGVGVELESADDPDGGSFCDVIIDADTWHFIGKDREPKHSYPLIVVDETHNRPIQQEVFETLGSSRKVIMRGFVLGHEGSLTTLWFNRDIVSQEDEQVTIQESFAGIRVADYLTRTPGPHIVKSPFGDVWDCQFSTPEYRWLQTGHLELKLDFVETGTTSETVY